MGRFFVFFFLGSLGGGFSMPDTDALDLGMCLAGVGRFGVSTQCPQLVQFSFLFCFGTQPDFERVCADRSGYRAYYILHTIRRASIVFLLLGFCVGPLSNAQDEKTCVALTLIHKTQDTCYFFTRG